VGGILESPYSSVCLSVDAICLEFISKTAEQISFKLCIFYVYNVLFHCNILTVNEVIDIFFFSFWGWIVLVVKMRDELLAYHDERKMPIVFHGHSSKAMVFNN
jgi:hypothetical protein